ncbi:hypothetical protein PHMEG_0007564 [Phytophthora megakarya]|uniref:Uncharacterized protein n=1 Tax=Phytophthora megakarya TaxID=4795 RepID=A0A225WL19_9STRA|nr:hypothetical protein PHMEG_0007564 [Phytophthora megakarya]
MADVDEELPNQAKKCGGALTTVDRLVEAENLEDGEIFEEGAPTPKMQIQQTMGRNNLPGYFDAHSVDAMGIRPHVRNKKQKKRGKKKNKRKVEAIQTTYTRLGEMQPEFDRSTRPRLFAEAPPPGQYSMSMIMNGANGEPMGMRPVYKDSLPPFRPGDSQILRVNRQGSMEMLDGGPRPSFHPMFSEPPMHGGFKYRSTPMTPPRLMAGEQSHLLQHSASRLLPIPSCAHCDTSNTIGTKESDGSDNFDLDSLRAAAIRSKVKRPLKTLTSTPTSSPTVPTVSVTPSSLLSSLVTSPLPNPNEERRSESISPEIDELRLEILRSMTRNRKRTASKSINNVQAPTLATSKASAVELPNQSSDHAEPADVEDNIINEKTMAADRDSSATKEPSNLLMQTFVKVKRIVSNGPPCTTEKSAAAYEQSESGEKVKPALQSVGSAVPLKEATVTTAEFRPLTACSQSLVIRLSPEDFSPRKSEGITRMKSTSSSSLHDAIKEMRRKIAEREKEQINRLLETTTARLSKQSTGLLSSCPASSSIPPELSQEQKVNSVTVQPSGTSTISPEVSSNATTIVKEPHSATTAGRVETKGVTDDVNVHANRTEGTIEQTSPSEGIPVSVVEIQSAEKAALETQERNETSAVSTYVNLHVLPHVFQHQVPTSDGRNGDPACEPCVKKSIAPVAVASH